MVVMMTGDRRWRLVQSLGKDDRALVVPTALLLPLLFQEQAALPAGAAAAAATKRTQPLQHGA